MTTLTTKDEPRTAEYAGGKYAAMALFVVFTILVNHYL